MKLDLEFAERLGDIQGRLILRERERLAEKLPPNVWIEALDRRLQALEGALFSKAMQSVEPDCPSAAGAWQRGFRCVVPPALAFVEPADGERDDASGWLRVFEERLASKLALGLAELLPPLSPEAERLVDRARISPVRRSRPLRLRCPATLLECFPC